MKSTLAIASILSSSMIMVKADPGCDVKPFDVEFWKYQNMMRTNPTDFVPYLQNMVTRFSGNNYQRRDGVTLQTNEGATAVNELITFLQSQSLLTPYKWSEPLWKAATGMVEEQGPTGGTGHTGPNGSTMQSRIEAQMSWEVTIGENINYGETTPLDAVLQLAIDDGVSSRGHRTNIFKNNFALTGIATGAHTTYTMETVTTYAGLNSPDSSYVAPTITVPQTVTGYSGYATWNQAATGCSSGDSGSNDNKPEESSASHMFMSLSVLALTSLFSMTM